MGDCNNPSGRAKKSHADEKKIDTSATSDALNGDARLSDCRGETQRSAESSSFRGVAIEIQKRAYDYSWKTVSLGDAKKRSRGPHA